MYSKKEMRLLTSPDVLEATKSLTLVGFILVAVTKEEVIFITAMMQGIIKQWRAYRVNDLKARLLLPYSKIDGYCLE